MVGREIWAKSNAGILNRIYGNFGLYSSGLDQFQCLLSHHATNPDRCNGRCLVALFASDICEVSHISDICEVFVSECTVYRMEMSSFSQVGSL